MILLSAARLLHIPIPRSGKLRLAAFVLCAYGLLPGLAVHSQARKPAKTADEPVPSGPTVLIDTTMGRVTCRLFSKQAPGIAANFVALANGTRDWTDAATGAVMHEKPFYDGSAIFAVTDGITSGDRLGGGKGVAGAPLPRREVWHRL